MSPSTPAPSLASQLSAKKQQIISSMDQATVDQLNSTSKDFAATFHPNAPAKGDTAPLFQLPNATRDTVSLSHLLAKHSAVVLTWYRGGWCPYCSLALRALTMANDDIERLGAKLVCLSPETPDESLSTKEKQQLSFEVLTDDGLEVADKYGIAFTVNDDIKALYSELGLRLDEMNANQEKGRKAKLPLPATFVLDKQGKVVYSYVNVDYTQRAEPQDIIDAIKSIV